MEHITPFPAAVATADLVAVLRCPQQLHFDPVPLNRLFAEKDHHAAEDILCRMLEDIAMRLDMLQQGMAGYHFDVMQRPARRIELIADRIGLTEVAIAAGHVQTCIRNRDPVGLDATMARLERGFDVAVAEVWNFREL